MSQSFQARVGRRLASAVRTKSLPVRLDRPVVSFTFDDAPRSAATHGARLLEAAGACGTFYVAGDLCGGQEDGRPFLGRDDLTRLHERGHELACHTFSHQRVSALGARDLAAELRANQDFISAACGDVRLRNFAYPFGDVSLSRKRQLQAAFATCRGITPGVNSGMADLGLLKAVAIYAESRDDEALAAYLDEASRQKGWLIFYTHDVDDQPSPWGASIEQFEHCVAAVVDRGFEILPVRNALGRLAFA